MGNFGYILLQPLGVDPTSITEWYMARCVFMNGHQKDMCHNKIELYAHITSTIIGSIMSTTHEDLRDCLKRKRISTWTCLILKLDNLHDLQMRHNSQFDLKAIHVCGVGSAHDKATYVNLKWF